MQRSNWPAIILLVFVGVSAALEFAKVSAVFEAVSSTYATDASVASWFVSLPAVATVLFGLTGSVIAARIGFRRSILGALALAVVLSALQASIPSVAIFLATRVLDGIVQLGIVVGAPVLILQLAAPRMRAFAMAVWGTFFGLAFALAGWVAPALVTGWGLWSVFAAHAVLAAVLLGAVWLWLPRVPGDGPQQIVGERFWQAHRSAYRSPRSVLPGAIFIFHTALYAVFVLYIPQLADDAIAPVLLVGMPLVSILGTLASGVVTARWLSPPVVLIAGFIGLISSLAALLATIADPSATVVLALVLMTCSGFIQGASFSLIPALSLEPTVTARANGVLMQLGNLGTLVGPPMFAMAVALGQLTGYGLLSVLLCLGGTAVSVLAVRLTGMRSA